MAADDDAQSLRLLEHAPYDLILLDCQMPVLDGHETAARVRVLQNANATIPVIALKARAGGAWMIT